MKAHEDFEKEIRTLFQNLHSLKGNSRIFGLSLISREVHKLENEMAGFLSKEKYVSEMNENLKGPDLSKFPTRESITQNLENERKKNISDLIQHLYGLHGTINSYLKAAKIVFGLVFKEDLDFKEKIHSSAMHLEVLFAKLLNLSSRGQSFNQIRETLNNNINKNHEIAEEIRKINHSIKGISRALQEKALSSQVHNFEGIFENLINDQIKGQEDFDETIHNSFNDFRYECEKVFLNTSFTKSYPFELNFRKEIFYKSFKLLKSFQVFEKDANSFIVDLMELKNFWASWHQQKKKDHTFVGQSDIILPLILLIQNILNQNEDDQVKKIRPYVKDLWTFLCLISQIDYSRPSLDLEKTIVEENQALIDLFFKYLQDNGHSQSEFNEALSDILKVEKEKVSSYLRSHYKLGHEMNAIYLELKKDISDGNLEKVIEVIYKTDDFTFFTLLSNFLKPSMMRW